jgi:hypothetical protein
MKETAWRKPISLVVAVLLLCLLIFESLWVYYVDFKKLSEATGNFDLSDVRTEIRDDAFEMRASFVVHYSVVFKSRIRVLALSLVAPVANSETVYVYFDERYPSSGLGLREWIGLKDHIPLELKKVGVVGKIVNAGELRDLMLRQEEVPVIIPSGVLPDTVYTRDGGLIGNWFVKGGILVWVGSAFGYYVGHKNGSLEFVGASGQRRLLGYELDIGNLSYREAIAENWTDFARALALSYAHAWTGPNLATLVKHNGLALGGVYKSTQGLEYSSISLLQNSKGEGRVIILGGGIGYAGSILGEDAVARDIAKILWSGLPFSQSVSYGGEDKESSTISPPIDYISYQLEGEGTIDDTLSIRTMTLPPTKGPILYAVVLMAYSLSPYTDFYARQVTFFAVGGA